ncbi:MAG: FG-GAP repeat protein, partial [Bacteroidota bacterium]
MRLALLLAFSALSFAASAQSLRGGPPVAPGAEATLTTDTPLARAAARVLAEDERFTNPAPATVPPLADGDAFGYAVAVSGDRAVVGAYQDDDTADNAGAAYVFERADGGWALAA